MSVGLNVLSTTAPVMTFLQLGADESRALAGLYMLELNDLKHVAVHLKRNAVFEISCYYHKYKSFPTTDGFIEYRQRREVVVAQTQPV